MSGLRPSDQLQQSYATLRGRKWSEKNCRGIGDNYGRHHAAAVANAAAAAAANLNFTDDARSVQSLADDFILPAPIVTSGVGGSHMLMTATMSRRSNSSSAQQAMAHSHHLKTLSRSTDKSLDSLGREDSTEQLLAYQGNHFIKFHQKIPFTVQSPAIYLSIYICMYLIIYFSFFPSLFLFLSVKYCLI